MCVRLPFLFPCVCIGPVLADDNELDLTKEITHNCFLACSVQWLTMVQLVMMARGQLLKQL